MRTQEKQTYDCNYLVAINWLNTSYVRCNHITSIDPHFDYREHNEPWYEEEDEDEENPIYPEFYQYYISSASESEVEWLEENFDIKFGYSPLLDCFVLLVDHSGTSWDYVYCATTNEYAKRELGEKK